MADLGRESGYLHDLLGLTPHPRVPGFPQKPLLMVHSGAALVQLSKATWYAKLGADPPLPANRSHPSHELS